MRNILLYILLFCLITKGSAQQDDRIRNMIWDEGNKILIEMENDSDYVMDISTLFHSETGQESGENHEFTHYPVVLARSFIDQLKTKNINSNVSTVVDSIEDKTYSTLWSGVHNVVGGGWVHFVNCLLYSLESGAFGLTDPFLKRPKSNWKPDPITESFKRTRKWEYYIPVTQKSAIKEYKIREKNNNLGDIKLIPQEYVSLFLNTNDKEYQVLLNKRDYKSTAKIDLVKVLLGSNYLGVSQIHFISNMVLKSMLNYSLNNPIPTIIVFDDLEAAVAMKLDIYGYHIEKVAFKEENDLSKSQMDDKMDILVTIVSGINEMNNRLFEKRLGILYK